MEPFGLFQFLQSLLTPSAASPTETPTEETQNVGASTANEAETTNSQAAKNNEAILHFISDHERRSRRTKRR